MMKYARSTGEDARADTALEYFTESSKNVRVARKGKDAFVKELIDMRLRDIDSAIKDEEPAFNKKEASGIMGMQHPFLVSAGLLIGAKEMSIERRKVSGDEELEESLGAPFVKREKAIVGTAEKRGDTIYGLPEPAPMILNYAIGFYKIAGNEKKIEKVKDKANKLGDAAHKNNKIEDAAYYYGIAGNKEKAKPLEKLTIKKKMEGMEKTMKDISKTTDEEEKKKRDKEKADLEKELGM